MPVMTQPMTEKEKLQEELKRIEKDIAAVSSKKLITVVAAGASDKVMYVTPYDLRGKDPEEMLPVVEKFVVSQDTDQGFLRSKVDSRNTGEFRPRGPFGPFGPTYKIDTSRNEGEKEYADFLRVLQTHVSRFSKVPEPVPYHSDVDSVTGMMDLKTITLTKDDVPVAVLENYNPLLLLQEQRTRLMRQMGEAVESAPAPAAVSASEAERVEQARKVVLMCGIEDCAYVGSSERGLGMHRLNKHGRR